MPPLPLQAFVDVSAVQALRRNDRFARPSDALPPTFARVRRDAFPQLCQCCYGQVMHCLFPCPADTATPSAQRVQMFVNPRAGKWRRRRVDALRTAFENAGAIVSVTSSLHAPLTVAEGIDRVCVVGGDGTIRHVAAAIVRADPQPLISVYPIGTVNLLARECGYVTEPDAFVRRALAPSVRRRQFMAQVDGTPILTCASVGPDSWTVDRVSPRLKRLVGRGAYLAAFVHVLTHWPRHRLTVVADDRPLQCEAVYVAKGRYFAGPWSFAPAAALDDPLLHVVALPTCSRRAFSRFLWSVLRGRVPKGVIRFTCTSLTIGGDGTVPVQADGDVVVRLPAKISVVTSPLSFS